MRTILAMLAIFLQSGFGASLSHGRQHVSVWQASNYKSLVTFGDSYTDENRLNYFLSHNGSAPPPGTFLPESFETAGGGRTWARYVVQYTGKSDAIGQWVPSLTLYNYAVKGAICSRYITPRPLPLIEGGFPSVQEYEIPAFLADKNSMRNGTSTPYFTPALAATDSLYVMFIGGNDLGVGTFLTGEQVSGKVLTDYTNCVYKALDRLYTAGARRVVLMTPPPLHLAPLYANTSLHGVTETYYWPKMPSNKTQIAEKMHEYTTSVNSILKYQTPYETLVSQRYPGASIAFFNVWQLMSDIYDNRSAYLNGTEPLNVQGFEHHCSSSQPPTCNDKYNGTSPDSFLWYDELHKSEQADRIIARNFVEVMNGKSKYASYY